MKCKVFHCCVAAALVVAFSGAASAQQCQTNDDCDDELACNGIETCVEEFCQSGEDPCPFQQCVENQGQAECVCTNEPFLFLTLVPSQTVVEPGQNVSFDITVEFDTCADLNAYAMRMDCSIPADSGSIDAVVC